MPGVVLFAGGLTIFLLPFTLASRAPSGWKTDYIIAMIVVGFLVLVAFGLYETYVAKEPFLKNKFLTDRSVIAACLIDMTYQISYYCWNSYFTSFLQVVCNLTVAEAGYVRTLSQLTALNPSTPALTLCQGQLNLPSSLRHPPLHRRLRHSPHGALQVAFLRDSPHLHLRPGSHDLLPAAQPAHRLHHHVRDLHQHWRQRFYPARAACVSRRRRPPVRSCRSGATVRLGHRWRRNWEYHLRRYLDEHLLRCLGARATTRGAEGRSYHLLQLAGATGVPGRLAGAHRHSAGVRVRADAHVGGGGGDIWTLLYLDVHDSEPECFEEWADEGYGLLNQAFGFRWDIAS